MLFLTSHELLNWMCFLLLHSTRHFFSLSLSLLHWHSYSNIVNKKVQCVNLPRLISITTQFGDLVCNVFESRMNFLLQQHALNQPAHLETIHDIFFLCSSQNVHAPHFTCIHTCTLHRSRWQNTDNCEEQCEKRIATQFDINFNTLNSRHMYTSTLLTAEFSLCYVWAGEKMMSCVSFLHTADTQLLLFRTAGRLQ